MSDSKPTTSTETTAASNATMSAKSSGKSTLRKPVLESPMPASTEMGIPSPEAVAYADALRKRSTGDDRWEPSRLIVCNWWMFTYQEFLLIDGHLVLNGLNGS